MDELQLFIRVALVAGERARHRQDVERDRLRVLARLGIVVAGQHVGGLLAERVDGGLARAGDGLVRRDRDALEADRVAHGAEDRHQLHGRAIRVGDDPTVRVRGVGIDVGDDERDVGLHAERGRVVDDRCARGDRDGGPLARTRGTGREDRHVDTGEGLGRDGLHRQLSTLEDHLRAGAALRREQHQLVDRQRALLEHLQHRAADGAGRAEDRNPSHGRPLPRSGPSPARRRRAAPGRPSAPRSSAPCRRP